MRRLTLLGLSLLLLTCAGLAGCEKRIHEARVPAASGHPAQPDLMPIAS